MQIENLKTRQAPAQFNWRSLYRSHLEQSLQRMISFVKARGKADAGLHIISLVTLLEESSCFPSLLDLRLKLIAALHPLPLRRGLSSRWEPRLKEIIDAPGYESGHNRNLIDLAEYYLVKGQVEQALETASKVLQNPGLISHEAADATRILFVAYRTQGNPEKADMVHQECGIKYGFIATTDLLNESNLTAWMKYHQTELELLRERGKTDEALALVNQMITMNEKIDDPLNNLSAELYVHRSTLLWVRAHYPEAISDLHAAVQSYSRQGDVFNAESLKSNLGLIYWTMGELDKAEENLLGAIRFYQRCGADQLMTYDIGNLGLVYFARGDLEQARQKTLEHIHHAEQIGFTTEAFRGHNNLGDILYYFGNYEQAIIEHEEIDKYFSKRGSREGYGLGKVWVACCRASLGDVDEAIIELKKILEWCHQHQSTVLEALTHRALALWLPVDQRGPHLQVSLALAREQGRQLEEAASLVMLAHVLKDQTQRDQTWRSGVEILARIGAISWLKGASIENPPFIAMFV